MVNSLMGALKIELYNDKLSQSRFHLVDKSSAILDHTSSEIDSTDLAPHPPTLPTTTRLR